MEIRFVIKREGHLTLTEHSDARWLGIEELDSVGWLPADRLMLDFVRKALSVCKR